MNSKTTPRTPKKATQAPETTPKTNGKKVAKKPTIGAQSATSPKVGLTLAQLAESYLKHLEEIGKSPATVFSYKMDLKIARDHFGDETPVIDLTPEKVAHFFDSDAVTKRKNGKPKTEVTINKIRRVLRLALVWAKETKLIDSVPLP